jgi:hypothetical protein
MKIIKKCFLSKKKFFLDHYKISLEKTIYISRLIMLYLEDFCLQFYQKNLITIPKKKHYFFYPPLLFFHSVPSLPYLLHPSISLHSVFLPVPFSPSLSFRYIHSTVFNSLSLAPRRTFCIFIPLLPSNTFLFFFLLVPTLRSRHHFSFFCTFSFPFPFLCHPSFILLVVSGFFDSFSSFLLVCVFVPFTQLYILPSSFCS